MDDNSLKYLKKLANNSDIQVWKILLDYRKTVAKDIQNLVNTINRKQIWDLCDGNRNVTDIATELGKSRPYISMEIKNWLDNRLVFEIIKGNSKFLVSIDSMIDMIFTSIDWEF